MKPVKASELREMSVADLQTMLAEQKANLYNYNRQTSLRQLKDYKSITATRRNVAKIMTIMTQKEKGGNV